MCGQKILLIKAEVFEKTKKKQKGACAGSPLYFSWLKCKLQASRQVGR